MAVAAVEGTGTVDVQYGLVHSTGELRKDTFLPYILHLAFDSGSQPFPHFTLCYYPSISQQTSKSSFSVSNTVVGSTITH